MALNTNGMGTSATNADGTSNPVALWLLQEAKNKLGDSLNKLGLDSIKINGKHLAAYSMDDLQLEKKKVKNELKYYDQAFQVRFSRLPNRNEKEPMRQIYMFYKRLKQYIQKATATGATLSGVNPP